MRPTTTELAIAGLATGVVALGLGCGELSSGGCGENGTCAPSDASVADQTSVEAQAAAPDASVDASDSSEAVDASDVADVADVEVCNADASPRESPCVVNVPGSGVFVAPGGVDEASGGTQSAPFATIGYALQHLGGASRVYVCAAQFAESVVVTSATSLYGGLDCLNDAGQAWGIIDGGLSQVTAPVNESALVITGVTGQVSIEDFAFVAPAASGQDDAGNGLSSIAAFVRNSGNVTFERCSFVARNGADGAEGGTGSNYVGAIAPDGGSNDGGTGGAGGGNFCLDGVTSSYGGRGGNSLLDTNGESGGSMPAAPADSGSGLDGIGGAGGVNKCGSGDNGANGLPGDAGAPAALYGTLSTWGWQPASGNPGENGNPGQGGGGGGGKTMAGIGGSGGGAGGCGGAGGQGGGGGGASIALICLQAGVSLDACTFVTGDGGAGGAGAAGQLGQGGGVYGLPPSDLCGGGYGGNGAGGSGGAGGTGGICACILFNDGGSEPAGQFTCILGSAGPAGPGGSGGSGGDNQPTQGNPGMAGLDGGPGLAGAAWQTQGL